MSNSSVLLSTACIKKVESSPEQYHWRMIHLTMPICWSPSHFHLCQVVAAEQTVGGVEVEEEVCDSILGLLVEDLEEGEVKGVEAMTCPSLNLQALVASEVVEVGAMKQV